ncbi:sugar transferase [Gordonia sp. NPDC003424]
MSSRPLLEPELRRAIVDRSVAALILVMTLPVLLGIAVVIAIDSRGAIFHGTTRLGIHNAPFRMWRFRTTTADAEPSPVEFDPTEVDPADPRVTRVGRVIKQYSLDELPQLFNVLSGSMTLVGPRPQRPGQPVLSPSSKPGMFGAPGRINVDTNWSATRDLTVLWQSLRGLTRL